MTDRRPLAMPAFSSDTASAPVPAHPGVRQLPVEQGADFRQPPGGTASVPAPARRRLSSGGLTFSDPDRRQQVFEAMLEGWHNQQLARNLLPG
ncbi:hypothetical protein AB0D10_37690 [Kitasatospora sp. NPDC048545]|uniref:hypothetical protein n=1 Tax=Kitasatospora sp. NPDC048545 TaxID=3157208 RepID=UPI0033F33E6F